MHLVIVFVASVTVTVNADLYQECAKLYGPNNYMSHLPSLNLPYLGDVDIPVNTPTIKPSPVMKTKAIRVVTKYVYKNPVCVKYDKKKRMCRQDNSIKQKGDVEQLVTKEYFVKDKHNDGWIDNNRHRKLLEEYGGKKKENYEDEGISGDYHDDDSPSNPNGLEVLLESSQGVALPLPKENRKTPNLSTKKIHEMLIEDRLDQLETILPHYTRRRIYETSTITVTKVLSNRRIMATLLVKNCIPHGYEFCGQKYRKRKSKVATLTNNSDERHYFG